MIAICKMIIKIFENQIYRIHHDFKIDKAIILIEYNVCWWFKEVLIFRIFTISNFNNLY